MGLGKPLPTDLGGSWPRHAAAKLATLEAEDAETARLVGRIQRGEERLLAELNRRYFDRAFAYLQVTVRGRHEVEDLIRDVFIRVFEALPNYEDRGVPFRAWLFRIVRNCALDRIRQRQRLRVESPDSLAGGL